MYLSEREMTMEAMIIDLLDSLGVFWFILLLAGLWIFFHFVDTPQIKMNR